MLSINKKNEHSGCICNSAVAVIFYARKQVTTSGSSLQKAKCQHFVQSFNMFNTLCALALGKAKFGVSWLSLS